MEKKPKSRFRKWLDRHGLTIVLVVLIFIFLTVMLAQSIFIPIHSGEVGVQWSRLFGGTITRKVYHEGLRIIVPWNKMVIYNVRFQEVNSTFDVLSKDGLTIEVEVQTRYRPVIDSLGFLHKHIGPDYVNVLLLPEVASHARQAISGYTPDELYATDRLTIQNLILKKLRKRTGVTETPVKKVKSGAAAAAAAGDDGEPKKKDREKKDLKKADKGEFSKDEDKDWIYVEDIFIKNIRLPQEVADAIESKLTQEQKMLEYDYIIQKERKEKERKIIEAEGIAEFQSVGGVSILKWKGIEATMSLAESPNSKLVIIGSGEEGGMPLILGPLSADLAPPPPPPATDQTATDQSGGSP